MHFFLHHPGRLYTVGKISTRNIHVCYDKDKQNNTFPAKMERKNDMGVFIKKLFE